MMKKLRVVLVFILFSACSKSSILNSNHSPNRPSIPQGPDTLGVT